MSTYSEEGSEANPDEDLLRDLDSLREVLEEDETTGKLKKRLVRATSGGAGNTSG